MYHLYANVTMKISAATNDDVKVLFNDITVQCQSPLTKEMLL